MNGFYDEVDSIGVVENSINRALHLENEQSQQILGQYSEIRKNLVDRLSRYPRDTFSAQHLRGVLAQVNGAIEAITRHLAGDTLQGAYKAALLGVESLFSELRVFDEKFTGAVTPINLNAALVAHDTSQLLVTRYQTNLAAYGNDLLTQITNGLFSATIGETSYDQVVGRISTFFTAEEWKLRRIVRTELHGVFNRGKINGMSELIDNETIEDLKKTLMHPMDARTGEDSIFAAQLGLVANVSEPFQYRWKGRLRVFMAPPDRPNDRAILVPYREEWGRVRGPAFVPGQFDAA